MTRRTQRLVGLIAAVALVMAGLGYLGLRSRSSSAAAAPADLVMAQLPRTSATPTAAPKPVAKKVIKHKKKVHRHKKPTSASSSPKPSTSTTTATSAPATTGTGTGSASDTVGSVKKGAATWNQDGLTASLKDSGVSWLYNWAPDPQQIQVPAGVDFVPMIWGAGAVNANDLANAKKSGNTLLAFNEPDMAGQANMTVDQALSLWPQLEATGMRLGAPAVAWGADQDGQWLDKFMTGAKDKGYRVDFIPLHWYGADFTSKNATNQLKSYIEAVHAKYNKPIWLTEYSLMNFGVSGAGRFPTPAQQAEFVTESTKMLESLSYVEHYAWFAFPTSTNGQDETGLYRPGGAITQPGEAYRAAG